MTRLRSTVLYSAALLALAPIVLAHGHDEDSDMGGMGMAMSSSDPSMSTPSPTMTADIEQPMSYFSYPDHKAWIWSHIAVMIVAWCFIAPIAVFLSVAKSRYTFPWQALFVLLNTVGVLLSVIYDASVPDLYEHNVHYRMGWVFTWFSIAWVLMSVVNIYARRSSERRNSGQKMSVANMARYQRISQTNEQDQPRWSRDSGQGTERNSASLLGSNGSGSPSTGSEDQHFDVELPPYQPATDSSEGEPEKRSFLKNTRLDRFLTKNLHKYATSRILSFNKWTYIFFERTMLIYAFFAVSSGFIVFGGLARGIMIFNLLAHFIKGGIFFWYGLLTLGRYMGSFADFGWAWNIKPPRSLIGNFRSWVPSGEFTESFVIFLYGITNVWLEHLGGWGGDWNPEDFQHISITILFAGGGLLGMLIESKRIRELLHTYMFQLKDDAAYIPDSTMTAADDAEAEGRWREPDTKNIPLNPLPALVILLLGIMMSAHTQHSMVSSMLHKQWGNLFAGFAAARMCTYLLFYLKPYTSYLPARPPTEIVASFCLIGGGLLFMSSTWPIVAALEERGIGAMFVFTVGMGLTAGVMAWETFCLALKGWAERRENPGLVRRIQEENRSAA